jgi:hypothetical protein
MARSSLVAVLALAGVSVFAFAACGDSSPPGSATDDTVVVDA